jgi:hypothetical protein
MFRKQFNCTNDIKKESSEKNFMAYISNESNFNGLEDSVYQQPTSYIFTAVKFGFATKELCILLKKKLRSDLYKNKQP